MRAAFQFLIEAGGGAYKRPSQLCEPVLCRLQLKHRIPQGFRYWTFATRALTLATRKYPGDLADAATVAQHALNFSANALTSIGWPERGFQHYRLRRVSRGVTSAVF